VYPRRSARPTAATARSTGDRCEAEAQTRSTGGT
jgi:hypothetical protein